ncbi:hypothetical protein [Dysgonomonas macrotermitis]|nr:hypothetical protein [Dysgonomonas macrotermitis]
MKTYPGYTRDQIRNELSYANMVQLLNVIPPYRSSSNDTKGQTPRKNTGQKQKYTHFEQFNF